MTVGAVFFEQSPGRGPGADASATVMPVPGPVLQTFEDGWTFCKATSKAVGRYQWVPWLSAAAAIISAGTATTIFATLSKSPAVWARVVVGLIAVLTAAITALQGWAAKRIEGLKKQQQEFHTFHREVEAALEQRGRTGLPENFADQIEKRLEAITAGMIDVGNRDWDRAKREMERDEMRTCPNLVPGSRT